MKAAEGHTSAALAGGSALTEAFEARDVPRQVAREAEDDRDDDDQRIATQQHARHCTAAAHDHEGDVEPSHLAVRATGAHQPLKNVTPVWVEPILPLDDTEHERE